MEKSASAILDGLNDEQKRAVQCSDGPVLIVAGAGSGKTRVLTSRIAYILAGGVRPSRILALTFTKKAAGEMKERIAAVVGEKTARPLVMGTFHAVFVRFLREYAAFLGYPDAFTIYDTSDSQSAIKACVKELNLDDKIYKPRDVLSRISMAKNNLVTPDAYKKNSSATMADMRARKPHICDIYDLYQKKLKQSGAMDFDDILLNMNILLRDNSEALEAISSRFSYIMVDEYQDTNYSQYLILKKLAGPHHNICVVGDDSQSIYAFRGAKIENILNFKKDYPECKVFRLERNYRSTSTIVDAANSLISHNAGRIPKECYSMAGEGEKIQVIKAYGDQDEAEEIVSGIKQRMRESRAQYEDFAILYRTNAQSRTIEDRLRRHNIPYKVYSGNSFFERAEVKDLMAYFKLVVNPLDDESFKRVINKPARGIGDTSVSALNECARAHGCPLFKAAFMQDTEIYGLKPAALFKIRTFCGMIEDLAIEAAGAGSAGSWPSVAFVNGGTASAAQRWDECAARSTVDSAPAVGPAQALEMAQKIADRSGLYAFYKSDTSIEGMARTANVEELINSVAAFVEEQLDASSDEFAEVSVTLSDYLENVSLLSNVDVSEDGDDVNNKVALMTVHSAKGLEFPYVYVAGMEENLFPSGGMLAPSTDIEEERRLFYVAITRAKAAVALSFAGSRMRNGKHESNPPSRFLKEIDSRFLDRPLDDEDFDNTGVTHEWGGFGSRFTGGRMDRFAQPRQTLQKPYPGRRRDSGYSAPKPTSMSQRPSTSSAAPKPASTPNPSASKPDVIYKDFVPVPMTELYEGERIEHDRFGAGEILQITGKVPELRASVSFDNYGVKVLLLKYAKMRPEKK